MSLTDRLLRGAPAQPLITHYDDAEDTRVELSVATMRNWAAKTANWLVDELDVEPGDRVAVLLPAHWQTAAVFLGAWWCGAEVVTAGAAKVAFVPAGATADAEVTAVASLDPMGQDLKGNAPSGTLDYIGESRLFGDDYAPRTPIPGNTPCFRGSTVDEILEKALSHAENQGITTDSRVLSTLDWPSGAMEGLVTVLAAGASLVQVTNADAEKLRKHAETERTTITLS